MLKKLCFSLLAMSAYILSSCSGPSARQEVAVLPTPVQLTTQSGMFVLKNGLKIGVSDESLLPAAQYLQTILQKAVIKKKKKRVKVNSTVNLYSFLLFL